MYDGLMYEILIEEKLKETLGWLYKKEEEMLIANDGICKE